MDREIEDEVAEFIVNRWLLKHQDIYGYFEKELEEGGSERLVKGAVARFGALTTYIFSVFNEVQFSEDVFQSLHAQVVKGREAG